MRATHAGYEWLYVLSSEMRLILGEHDITMRAGEVAEFDSRLPHWFGPVGDEPVEILSPRQSGSADARPRGSAPQARGRLKQPPPPGPLRSVEPAQTRGTAPACRTIVSSAGRAAALDEQRHSRAATTY
jgi:hypothetical protein